MAEGKSNKEVANLLNLSLKTVEARRTHIGVDPVRGAKRHHQLSQSLVGKPVCLCIATPCGQECSGLITENLSSAATSQSIASAATK
ncbi:MAG: LuxR C-terminal-related transcriptional regulator [Bryobacteraceae bacterium]